LAQALAAEQQVAEAVDRAISMIRRETELAVAMSAGDAAVEAFAAWLPSGLAERNRARELLAQAEAATAVARAALIAARTAEASVESLLESRLAEERLGDARGAQQVLDEVATTRFRGCGEPFGTRSV